MSKNHVTVTIFEAELWSNDMVQAYVLMTLSTQQRAFAFCVFYSSFSIASTLLQIAV